MMDAISLINEALQIIYAFVPKELVIIILAWFVISAQILYKDYKKNANKDN